MENDLNERVDQPDKSDCKQNQERVLAGFWTRLVALGLDVAILFGLGSLLGLFYFDQLSSLGGWGLVLGFSIALFYRAIMHSRLCNGQTIGKRICKIKVVDRAGESVSVRLAAIRCIALELPFVLNGASLPSFFEVVPVWQLQAAIVFGGSLLVAYLYVFNRRTRQSLHDLATGTYVVRAGERQPVPASGIWGGHVVVSGIIVIGALTLAAVLPFMAGKIQELPVMQDVAPLQNYVASLPGVTAASTYVGETAFAGVTIKHDSGEWSPTQRATRFLQISVVKSGDGPSVQDMEKSIAEAALRLFPSVQEKDLIITDISQGYDIYIASGSINKTERKSPQEWKDYLGLKNI